MSIRVLRRIRSLDELPITTVSAPILGPAIDITADGPPLPVSQPVATPPLEVEELTLAAMPAPREPGICYHDFHGDYQGRRFGVLVVDEHHASLLPCPFVNEDGC